MQDYREIHDILLFVGTSKFSQPKIKVEHKELLQWLLEMIQNCPGKYGQKQTSKQTKTNLRGQCKAQMYCN